MRHMRLGFYPWVGNSPGVGKGNPLQYSCLENSMDRGPGRLQSMGSQRVRHHWAHGGAGRLPQRSLDYAPLGIFIGVSLLRPWPLSKCQCQPDLCKLVRVEPIYHWNLHRKSKDGGCTEKPMWKALSHVWLCHPKDYTVHRILQTRILEWVAFPFSRGPSQPRNRTKVSHIAGRFFTKLSYKGSPRILEWVAHSFSRGSSWPRNQIGVSCIAGRFFTNWAIREAYKHIVILPWWDTSMA